VAGVNEGVLAAVLAVAFVAGLIVLCFSLLTGRLPCEVQERRTAEAKPTASRSSPAVGIFIAKDRWFVYATPGSRSSSGTQWRRSWAG